MTATGLLKAGLRCGGLGEYELPGGCQAFGVPLSAPPVLAAVRAIGVKIGGVWPAGISCLGLLVLLEVLHIRLLKI